LQKSWQFHTFGKNVAIFWELFFPKESFLGHVAWDMKKKKIKNG
jgi:hypothetical protein